MKPVLFGIFIIVSCCFTATLYAQNGNGGQRQQEMRAYLKDSVNLSDALADSVTSINREFQPQMRTIFMDQSMNAADKQTKMQAMQSDMEVRYKSAGLSDEQIQKIRDHRNRVMTQMRSRMGNGSNR